VNRGGDRGMMESHKECGNLANIGEKMQLNKQICGSIGDTSVQKNYNMAQEHGPMPENTSNPILPQHGLVGEVGHAFTGTDHDGVQNGAGGMNRGAISNSSNVDFMQNETAIENMVEKGSTVGENEVEPRKGSQSVKTWKRQARKKPITGGERISELNKLCKRKGGDDTVDRKGVETEKKLKKAKGEALWFEFEKAGLWNSPA
jgi:hypothetical protein